MRVKIRKQIMMNNSIIWAGMTISWMSKNLILSMCLLQVITL